MFPFTPRHVSQARLYLREASKLLAYRRDTVSPQEVLGVEEAIRHLKEIHQSAAPEAVQSAMERLDQVCGTLQPPGAASSWRENVEVFIVAITVALGVRTYFVQPFTIPTGSMQPTLNGIITRATDTPPPNPLQRAVELVVAGRSYFNLVAERAETIVSVQEKHYFGIPLGFFSYTSIQTDAGEYAARIPVSALAADSRFSLGRQLKPGEIIARGYSDTGDHVLVDKFTYHFRNPERSNVFVFNTAGIPTRENLIRPGSPSQFYIKRLAGVPGDQLRVEPPKLFLNGSPAQEWAFQRVMAGSLENPAEGYRGYSNGPEHSTFRYLGSPKATFEVPAKSYFALGDNSYQSSDSRDWGLVPERNVVGRGLMVYWPFNKHWGFVR
jgi:signal peptidase I